MIPVEQSITGDNGDCLRACVASILELPISELPNFVEHEDMHAAATSWLAPRGIAFLPMYFLNPDALQQTYFGFYDFCIVGGTSPRKDARGDHRRHAVVAKTLPWGVEILHDPHPDKSGLLNWGVRWLYLLVFQPKVTSLEHGT
jgi:hypothetical protein